MQKMTFSMEDRAPGDEMYGWARDLFPLCRSISGQGVRETLHYLARHLPELTVHEVPSGTKVFDWTVPDEWNVRDAYVMDHTGRRVIDFRASNLHLVGYSEPVDTEMDLSDLQGHLHSLEELPDAIPYVTSYYERRWGFCLSHNERRRLEPGLYRVVIDSTLAPGALNYGEVILPGRESAEVLISANICHPSMANNELSGPVLLTAIGRWLSGIPNRRLTYRLVFVPETIGPLMYMSRNLDIMKRHMISGFVVTCVGDDGPYHLIRSRLGNTLADRVAAHVLSGHAPGFADLSYLHRGSDERQYGSPRAGLPVVCLTRSKFGAYPAYHSSFDNLDLISPAGLGSSFSMLAKCIAVLENNQVYRATNVGEPQLGRRGLKPTLSVRNMGKGETVQMFRTYQNLLAYADGAHDLIAMAERIGASALDCVPFIETLLAHGLIEPVS